MSETPKSFHLSADVHSYLVDHGTPPDDVAAELIEATEALGGVSLMQIAPEQGAFMTLLVAAIGATNAVEVGTFTGYSALCIARGLGDDGHLVCCDVSDEWVDIGRPFWRRAGVAERIEVRIGPALQTLQAMAPDPVVDLAFIDADKPSYNDYFNELVPRLRPGGLLLVDNVLWFGRVVDPDDDDPDTRAIRAFNEMAANDDRVETVMLPVGDGLTICRKHG